MDYDKLIERLRGYCQEWEAYSREQYRHDLEDAAEGISKIYRLQVENENLRAELAELRAQWDMYGGDEGITATYVELERVKAERDAAIADWRGFCAKCAWNGRQYLADGKMDDRCKTCRKNGKCNWKWRGIKEA